MTKDAKKFKLLTYIEESKRPGTCLAFVLPILVTYEIGIRIINIDTTTHTVNGADAIIKESLRQVGFYGSLLSAICIILTLFLLHLHRGYNWHIRKSTIFTMIPESILVALPLLALDRLVKHVIMAIGAGEATIGETIILSLGAGVYEEYLFRLVLLGGSLYLINRLFKRHKNFIQPACVIIVSVLFAVFHHIGPFGDTFELRIFAFRTLAGIYFSWIYLSRGFGIAVGCHTAYDLMVVGLKLWQHLEHMK
ncbi:MAG: CPBP family intramembrane glutamic endopeptidase [Planctomycetota bacterium]|jgi:hypothetical protein